MDAKVPQRLDDEELAPSASSLPTGSGLPPEGRGRGRRWPQHALRPGCVLRKTRQQSTAVLSAAEHVQLQPSSKRPLFTGQEPPGSPATPRPRAAPGGHGEGVLGHSQSSRNERPLPPRARGLGTTVSCDGRVSTLGSFSLKSLIEGKVFLLTVKPAHWDRLRTHRSVSRGGGWSHSLSPGSAWARAPSRRPSAWRLTHRQETPGRTSLS